MGLNIERSKQGLVVDNIKSSIETARHDLIDLGLRNPMLNYRTRKASGLEIVEESSGAVYDILVRQNRRMEFLANEELDEVGSLYLTPIPFAYAFFNPLIKDFSYYFLLSIEVKELTEEDIKLFTVDKASKSNLTDTYLQTDYSTKELQKRLLKTAYDANIYIEEQGVNALFIGLGMLHWYEDESSEEERSAPLILVPVELSRKTVTSGFQIAYTGDGIGGNLSLQARLNNDFAFKIALPEFDENTDESDFQVTEYFNQLEEQIADKSRWYVEQDAIVLGFFAYSKYMMYMDLDTQKWSDNAFENHSIISKLLGEGFSNQFGTQLENFTREEIDEYLSVENNFHVMDADSSQAQAILTAKQGGNLVIQGPPGTGKSQTIANIIAEFVGEGKTVLFISEKMAALEVVKRRLDTVGVGDLCLALHSYKTNKKTVLDELERTLRLGEIPDNDFESQLADFKSVRRQLTAYSDAVNTPINASRVTPYQAFGKLLKIAPELAETTLPVWADKNAKHWSQEDFKKKCEVVEEVERVLQRIGKPTAHPFWGTKLKVIIPSTKDDILRFAKRALEYLGDIKQQIRLLAEQLDVDAPDTFSGAKALCRIIRKLSDLPSDANIGWESSDWFKLKSEVERLIDAGITLQAIRERYEDQLIPQAWEQDLLSVRLAIKNDGDSFIRFIKPGYRKAISTLKGLFVNQVPKDAPAQLEAIDDIMQVQELSKAIRQRDDLGKRLFGTLWLDDSSNWTLLAQFASALADFYEAVHQKCISDQALQTLRNFDGITTIQSVNSELDQSLKDYEEALQSLFSTLKLNVSERFESGGSHEKQVFADQQAMLMSWRTNIDDVNDIATYNQQCQQLISVGLESLMIIIQTWEDAPQYLTIFFERMYLDSLIEDAITNREELSHFSRESHERRLEQFRKMDSLVFQSNRHQILKKHFNKLSNTNMGSGQVAILRREFEKKRRHKPIRRLITETAQAIQAIKPVFMMSPMSIATYLEPTRINFDLVVFDEASQIRPAEALGAIARGKQVIVVGDSKQLPPTSFFDSPSDNDDEDAITSHTESILGLFNAQSVKEQMLRWHYRSQHESLIATSNFEFYDNRLYIFPSPTQMNAGEIGLKFRYLPNTYYITGKSHNPGEAKEVALAVIKHAQEHPDLTLGVASFSNAQTQIIRDELELLRRQYPETEPFFTAHPSEPFFVKNLENVQGDERDVILISIGYGKQEDGKLSLNFGPLNRDGGERRLNVLITRAKLRCEIFTNLQHHDIDLSRTSSKGLSALKRYLKYAETGELELPELTGRGFDSAFEQAIAQRLEHEGYTIHNQIGTAGFFIDLAVVDPKHPGRYIVGIECDGATYHRSASARERDRLRQDILESKGWQIHRIWSTDWYRNPERELAKAIQAIEEAKNKKFEKLQSNNGSHPEIIINRPINEEIVNGDVNLFKLEPYQIAELPQFYFSDIGEVSDSQIKKLIFSLLEIESPIHQEEVIKRVSNALGFYRTGHNIKSKLSAVIDYLVRNREVKRTGDFLTTLTAKIIGRDRSEILNNKDIMLVSPQEIEVVVEHIVKNSLGIQQEELIQITCNSLGFARITKKSTAYVSELIDSMISEHRLKIENKHLFVQDKR